MKNILNTRFNLIKSGNEIQYYAIIKQVLQLNIVNLTIKA
jgi:hypothetical protein